MNLLLFFVLFIILQVIIFGIIFKVWNSIYLMVFEEFISNIGLTQIQFARSLLFLLFFILIFIVFGKTPYFRDNRGINVIISLALALLAIYYMREDVLVDYVLRPYSNLGLLFWFGVPFLILLFIAHRTNIGGAARKILWAFYSIIILALWYNRRSFLTYEDEWTFIISLGLAIAMIIFDSLIHKALRKKN